MSKMTGEPVTPNPDKNAQAYHDWFYKSIVDVEKERFEIGKFLFGVTSGSLGILVTVSQFTGKKWGLIEPFALIAFLVSAFPSLYLALPTWNRVLPHSDLQSLHARIIKRTWFATSGWTILWIL